MTGDNTLRGKNVLVVGAGSSGMAAISALRKEGAVISLQDQKSREDMNPKVLEYIDGKLAEEFLGTVPGDTEKYHMLVLSPGVPPDTPFIGMCRKNGAKIIGELELAYMMTQGRFAAITGTNGKTTTTALTGEIFAKAGKDHHVVGNIGIPVVSKAAMAEKDTWLITEVSSFQLETIEKFRPQVACVLNLTPDHMDRHKTMGEYGKVKARIFENQTKDDFAVINYDDKACRAMLKGTKGKAFPFSRKEELDGGAFIDGGNIVVREKDKKPQIVCAAGDLKIPGEHNLENALAATAMAYCAGIDIKKIAAALKSFNGVEHRLEYCGSAEGIRYVNDSKGTNTDAAIKAIHAIDGRIVMIAGGYDKGADYEDLIKEFKNKVICTVLIGKTAVKIKNTAEKMGFTDTLIVEDMESAVREATRKAGAGDTVLLSPACASWDMYKNFEERGRHFKECVKKLGAER